MATVKYPTLAGVRLLIIQPVDARDNPQGDPMFAADGMQAGPGDLISWITGSEASLALPNHFAPVDCAVVSIVDQAWSDPRANGVETAP